VLFLARAAQLITIHHLGAGRRGSPPVTWASVLLTIAPAPLAAVAAFAPAPVSRLAAVAGVLVLVAGIAQAWRHTGPFTSRRWWPCVPVVPSCGVSDLDPARGRHDDGLSDEGSHRGWAGLVAAAVLLPFRASWPDTNAALLLVLVVVAVAAIGNRVAGGVAAVWAAIWFHFFFTLPIYYRFPIRSSAEVTTAVLLLLTGPGRACAAGACGRVHLAGG
jgi:hypothetical protein